MPAIHLGASPGPGPPSSCNCRDDTIAETTSAPARSSPNPQRSRLQDASFEETMGLFMRSQEASRFASQDAQFTKPPVKPRKPQTTAKAGTMGPPQSLPVREPIRSTPPVRPPRPSPETLAATQKYLRPTLTQSRHSCSMPVTRPASQLSESPSKEQEQASSGLEVQSPGRNLLSPRKQMAKKKSVAHLRLSLPERRQSSNTPKHMSNSTLDSSVATPNDVSKDFSKPTSALSHWVDNSAWPPWSPRSRAASGVAEVDVTDPSDPPSETPGSASKARRRLFRHSEASSQRESAQEPNSSRRNILRSLGMSWDNKSSSSDSSWSSFGCVDGMRRPDLEDEEALGGEKKKESKGKENDKAPSTPMSPLTPGKTSLTRSAGRKMLRKMTG